jgi:hypothetical protein
MAKIEWGWTTTRARHGEIAVRVGAPNEHRIICSSHGEALEIAATTTSSRILSLRWNRVACEVERDARWAIQALPAGPERSALADRLAAEALAIAEQLQTKALQRSAGRP